MKAGLKVAQIIGVLMLGIGIGVGYNGGTFGMAVLGLAVYAGAKLTSWVKSDKD